MLYINKVAQKKHVFPPKAQDVLNCDKEMRSKMEKLELVHTEAIRDKGSLFRGHAVRVRNSGEVNAAYVKMRMLYQESDHIMMGYSVKQYTGHHDNGEHTAGRKILQVLMQKGHINTAVFVTREHGGPQLGPRRFIHIESAARNALNQLWENP